MLTCLNELRVLTRLSPVYIVPKTLVQKIKCSASYVGKYYHFGCSVVAVGNKKYDESIRKQDNKAIGNRF